MHVCGRYFLIDERRYRNQQNTCFCGALRFFSDSCCFSLAQWGSLLQPVCEQCVSKRTHKPFEIGGCRGGSRNVEVPSCKFPISKLQNFNFQVSKFPIFEIPNSQFSKDQHFDIFRIHNFQSFKFPKVQKIKIQKIRCKYLPQFSEFQILRYEKVIFPRMPT